jgi:hypothetical protein
VKFINNLMKQKQTSKTNTPKGKSLTTPISQASRNEFDLESYRFTHYQPQAIDCMSLSSDGKLMAVARANCSIEIWLKDSWSQLCVIPGN